MRLIDADALIKSMKSHTVEDNGLANDYKAGLTDSIRTAVALAENASTIDAVPVVRGEWVEAKSGVMSVWPDGQVMCSVCKQRMPLAWKKMPPYCYGCGAKMEDKLCG